MVGDPAAVAEQAAGCAASRRPAGLERDLLAAADRFALGGHPGALRAAHDLRKPLQSVARSGGVGSDFWKRFQRLTMAISR